MYARPVRTEADASALTKLLEVQADDSASRLLTHQKETMPEAHRLAQIREQLAELRADLEIAGKQAAEASRDQDKLEGEIAISEEKIAREENRLFSGAVSNPKELGSLQDEVAMLKRKKSELEDQLLEVMVRKEQADTTAGELNAEAERVGAEEAELATVVGKLTSEIDAELSEHTTHRQDAARDIPEDLLSLYETLRDTKGGVGAAALKGGTCEGCHTRLPSREVERVRAEGGLQRCDNCRRILVVT
jgi:uncharacterized protein